MKRFTARVLGLVLGTIGTQALADPSVLYGRIDGGASFSNALSGNYIQRTGLGGDPASTGLVNIGLGAALPVPGISLRSELDLSYRSNYALRESNPSAGGPILTRSHFGNLTSTLNVIWDVPVPFRIKPFLGIGAGVGNNKVDGIRTSGGPAGRTPSFEAGDINDPFVWNAIAGLSYNLTPGIGLDLTYRYVDGGDLRSGGVDSTGRRFLNVRSDLRTNDTTIGLRFGF